MPRKKPSKPVSSLEQTWETFEEVTAQLLEDSKKLLGIDKVTRHSRQNKPLPGKQTSWRIDVTAYDVKDEILVIVECKRWTTDRVSQEDMGGFAYRIKDLSAKGIIVTTLPLQAGAQKIAEGENIRHILLEPGTTSDDYTAQLTQGLFKTNIIKRAEQLSITDSITLTSHVIPPADQLTVTDSIELKSSYLSKNKQADMQLP